MNVSAPPPSSNVADDDDDDGLPAYAIIIIVIGLVLLIAIVILITVCVFCCNITDRLYDKKCVSTRCLNYGVSDLPYLCSRIQYVHLIIQCWRYLKIGAP